MPIGMAYELQRKLEEVLVSAKLLQFSSAPSTRVVHVRAIPLQWTGLDPSLGGNGFLGSWILEDCEAQEQRNERRQIRWSAIGGLALAFAVSAGFWAGVGLLISRFA